MSLLVNPLKSKRFLRGAGFLGLLLLMEGTTGDPKGGPLAFLLPFQIPAKASVGLAFMGSVLMGFAALSLRKLEKKSEAN